MKRQSIFLILLLSFILSVTCGCSASAPKSDAALPQTTSDLAVVEESAPMEEEADTAGSAPLRRSWRKH